MRKLIALFIVLALASLAIAACSNDNNISPANGPDKCPLNMINPLSCKEGVVTYTDNGCSVTKCKEDTGLLGSEQLKNQQQKP